MNNGNSNHFYGLSLRGKQSNRNGVGAKVQVYSALGIQTREVRSGESYGISNSLQLHFGMGQITEIDSVIVQWPSGIRDVIYQPVVDQYITHFEGNCTPPKVTLLADGPTTFCTGQSVTLRTDADFDTYQWNTGDTTASIIATAEGAYKVTVTSSEGCSAISNAIVLVINPIQIPTVEALGDTTLCSGGEVVLVASDALGYLWSSGETTQSIAVNQSGQYTVAAQGLCEVFGSAPMHITVLDAPLPAVEPDTILAGESATLVALGDQITWFDSETAQINLAVNDTLITPTLTENTTYWVSNTAVYGLPNDFVGMVDHQGSATSDVNYNGGLIFDCFKPFVLAKTKVITAIPGERKVELRNVNDVVLQSKTVNIPAGTTVIDLNFDVPVGNDFLLTTNETVNESSLNSSGPQLRRSSLGCNFPYTIEEVVSIKNSTFNTERYYYFFDWEISYYGYECTSPRIPVTVVVEDKNSATTVPSWASGLRIFPNPTTSLLHLELQDFAGGQLLISIKNAQGQSLQTNALISGVGKLDFSTDLSLFPAGIYWLELAGEGGTTQRKIVVR